jgi:hypothetical protein
VVVASDVPDRTVFKVTIPRQEVHMSRPGVASSIV